MLSGGLDKRIGEFRQTDKISLSVNKLCLCFLCFKTQKDTEDHKPAFRFRIFSVSTDFPYFKKPVRLMG